MNKLGSVGRAGWASWMLSVLPALSALLPLCVLIGLGMPAHAQTEVAKAAAPAASAPIAAAAFYRQADLERATLSPTGRWLALTASTGAERTGLFILDAQTLAQGRLAVRFTDADIGDVRWVNDERLVFEVLDREAGGGEQRFGAGLFSIKPDGSELRQLIELRHDFIVSPNLARARLLSAFHRLLHVPAGEGDEVVVGEWQFDQGRDLLGVVPKRLNVTTGRATSLALGAPSHVRQWLFDRTGQPRVAVAVHEGRSAVHWRRDDGSWSRLAEHATLDAPFSPHSVDSDGQLYVTVHGPGQDTSVLSRFDFAKGQPEPEPLVKTPGFDFIGTLVTETTGAKALGVRVLTDAETTVWFDKTLGDLQRQADARLPGRINRLNCRRCGQPDMAVLVRSWSDADPGQLWLYQAKTAAWRKIGAVRSAIAPDRMASTDLVRIAARDGLQLPVWLTRPHGAPSKAALPTVVLIHGGPWVRGRAWQWSADAQFLASRGYLVIEPEFRGSRGYGEKLFRAGWRQWGQAMQDDVQDALQWAVQAGQADAARVCVAGASYGGYATLMALIRYPKSYRCGIAWVAVTDPRLLFKWSPSSDVDSETRQHSLPTMLGDPDKDGAMFDAATPVLHAARIQAPLLLAFGDRDRRVPLEHGLRLRDALKQADKPFDWVVYEGEGHGWLKADNRIDFAGRMERFLAQHLK